jgi:hypothetical protein
MTRVRDNGWRSALTHLPQLLNAFAEQGTKVKVVVFAYGIGELYWQPAVDLFSRAVGDACGNAGRPDRDERQELDVISASAAEFEARNISLAFIGDGFAWMFDRSRSTFSGSPTAHKPVVPIMLMPTVV